MSSYREKLQTDRQRKAQTDRWTDRGDTIVPPSRSKGPRGKQRDTSVIKIKVQQMNFLLLLTYLFIYLFIYLFLTL